MISCHACRANKLQPTRKAVPPIGVSAPSQRAPVSAIPYKLPENSRIPETKHQPAAEQYFACAGRLPHPTTQSASAWYM